MSIVKLNNNGVKNATAFGSITGLGSMVFIKKLTASSSATLSFVDGSNGVTLDNSYKEYLFTFKNIHPQNNSSSEFTFNMSTDSGSNYNTTKTTTHFIAQHAEDGSYASLEYRSSGDLAQSTNFQQITADVGNDNDQNLGGYLHLFNPSSTTFVKHFTSTINFSQPSDYSVVSHVAGYGNTTSAVDAIQFKFSSGNIDSGDICLYGIA